MNRADAHHPRSPYWPRHALFLLLPACFHTEYLLDDAGGGHDDAGGHDAAPSRIAYVAPFVQNSSGAGASDSFPARAHAASNAVVLQVSCNASEVPTAVSVSASGWTFAQLGPITASTSSTQRSATFVAITPDAADTTVTVNWSGSTCTSSKNEIGDEFAMADPAGGAVTFDGSNATQDTGSCAGAVTTGHADDAVWAACNSENKVTAVGSGFIKGADDRAGDWSEYTITNDHAGTVEAVQFVNGNVGYVLSMVTLKSQ
jgi:hypothetical protein